jgi:hypothetical protein
MSCHRESGNLGNPAGGRVILFLTGAFISVDGTRFWTWKEFKQATEEAYRPVLSLDDLRHLQDLNTRFIEMTLC